MFNDASQKIYDYQYIAKTKTMKSSLKIVVCLTRQYRKKTFILQDISDSIVKHSGNAGNKPRFVVKD